jgi:hypothetical protein
MKFEVTSTGVQRAAFLLFGVVCSLLGAVLWVGAGEKQVNLLLVSTPFGEGESARIARALLPESGRGPDFIPISRVDGDRPGSGVSDGGTEADGGVGWAPEEVDPEIAEQAREAALRFNLVLAAELWRRAADDLVASDAVVFHPKKVARVLMEAGAASSAAGERDLSLDYFRKAIAVESDIRPGPEISPDAKRLFGTARRLGPILLEMPRETVLADICEMVEADGMIWVAAGRDGDAWVVSFKLYVAGSAATELETRRHETPLDDQKIEAEQKRLQGLVARKLLGDESGPKPIVQIGLMETTVTKPWYRKWWVYVIGGAVIAGGAAGITTWLMLQPKEATVTAHY